MDAERSGEVNWSPERELVLTRVFAARRELVFRAWTEVEHLSRWFGPKGFTTTTHEIDVRVGGRWRFDMLAPNGQVFDNRMVFLEVTPPERLVFDHGHDTDDDPEKFRVTVTFEEQSDKKTVVTMRQLHPTKALRDVKLGFGAVELGHQTLDKLAEHLRGM
jgi:uncharacterized protein YndB with AHSA1/START domain